MPSLTRRRLCQALASAGVLTMAPGQAEVPRELLVANVTGLYTVKVARIETPRSAAEVSGLLRAWPGQVSIGGGRYSMGGQVAIADGLHLDMREMKALVWLKADERRVRVQAGMRWRDLQDVIDPLGLAVKTMQSYANFTVGGAVSVNAHGRYVGNGGVGHSVRALQLVLADGAIVEASREQRAELFRAAIGGYGAVGAITEVELDLVPNVRMKRIVQKVPLEAYAEFFQHAVAGDARNVMHNADLLPPHFDLPVAITWRESDEPLTEPARLVPRGQRYALEQNVVWALTELPGGAKVRRSILHPLLTADPAVKWRNHEASLDVAELEPRTRSLSTYVLQEYFIPVRHFVPSARGMAQVLRKHDVMALNISVRHSPADALSLLPWAKEEVFSFVLYYKQRVHASAQDAVGRWTRELIELALAHEGRHYLPYQLHATQAQFDLAYPEAERLRALKRRVDPAGKLTNAMWARYL
ncbi:FAD-binding oxidoreductase [Piscinibacter sp. HJYY11]|uniref:FAD-binding oxidoreductase n=1 Tax=Piscinibacter sp. HJYY11 TaxID=2801333 RepID=UPI001F352FA0|nr:FAD-binding oxidoreductase [Piscinibacter sp. HJYY11]